MYVEYFAEGPACFGWRGGCGMRRPKLGRMRTHVHCLLHTPSLLESGVSRVGARHALDDVRHRQQTTGFVEGVCTHTTYE